MEKAIAINKIIHKLPLFTGLSKEELYSIIAPLITLKEFDEGMVIFNEGDIGTNMYFLLEGSVDIVKKKNSGEAQKLFTMYPPSMFGEMSLIDKSTRSATAIASVKSAAASLKKADFDKIINDNPEVAVNILKHIARILSIRIRKTSDNYIDSIKEEDSTIIKSSK